MKDAKTPDPPVDPDFEQRSLDAVCVNESQLQHPWWHNLKYTAWGLMFGVVFVKTEIISWFILIKRLKARTMHGETIVIHPKEFNKGQIYGGLIFGLGWAITGACPGPLFAQMGAGFGAISITFLFAVVGTWVYGLIRERLPH